MSYDDERKRMVDEQIASRGIKDRKLIDAILAVPRHEFVPEEYKEYSYNDGPLPIGYGQTISQPYIVALMTELLEVSTGDKVLEIGTGSGYQAAILSEMGCLVYTIEIVEELAERAKEILTSLGYRNIFFRTGDGYGGWEENSPYDAIIATACPSKVPEPLLNQLKVGGRMVIPVGERYQDLKLIVKRESDYDIKNIVPVSFVRMTGKAGAVYD